jgi:hypothetical protein
MFIPSASTTGFIFLIIFKKSFHKRNKLTFFKWDMHALGIHNNSFLRVRQTRIVENNQFSDQLPRTPPVGHFLSHGHSPIS